MYGHVFSGQIVIIPVIGVKILHFLGVERYFEDTAVSLDFQIAVVGACIDPGGEREVHLKAHQQFFCRLTFVVCVIIGLGAVYSHFHILKTRKSGERQKFQQPFHIGLIVQHEPVQHLQRRQQKIFFIGVDHFLPVRVFCPARPQACLDSLLSVIGQSQKVAVGRDVGVQIHGFHGEKRSCVGEQTVNIHAGAQKRQIKAVSVIVDDVFVFAAENEKGGEEHFFIQSRVVKPLSHLPAFRLHINTADEVNSAVAAADPGGLNIQKQDFLRLRRHVRQRKEKFLIDCFADDTHIAPFALPPAAFRPQLF